MIVISEEQVREIERWYRRGYLIREIAKVSGVSWVTTRKYMRRMGLRADMVSEGMKRHRAYRKGELDKIGRGIVSAGVAKDAENMTKIMPGGDENVRRRGQGMATLVKPREYAAGENVDGVARMWGAPMCEEPRANCVRCRDIFDERCRWFGGDLR